MCIRDSTLSARTHASRSNVPGRAPGLDPGACLESLPPAREGPAPPAHGRLRLDRGRRRGRRRVRVRRARRVPGRPPRLRRASPALGRDPAPERLSRRRGRPVEGAGPAQADAARRRDDVVQRRARVRPRTALVGRGHGPPRRDRHHGRTDPREAGPAGGRGRGARRHGVALAALCGRPPRSELRPVRLVRAAPRPPRRARFRGGGDTERARGGRASDRGRQALRPARQRKRGLVIGISLLTLVPGASGAGIERYARDLCRGLGHCGSRAYVALLPTVAPGAADGIPGRVIGGYPASRSLTGRAVAMAFAVARPGRVAREMLAGGVKALHYPLTVMIPPVTRVPAAAVSY